MYVFTHTAYIYASSNGSVEKSSARMSSSTRMSSENMIATPNPLSEMENDDGNIDNVNSDLFRAGEEMPSMDDFTDNDIQELCNFILPGYQKDAIPFSPDTLNMNRCKTLIIILTSNEISCNNIIKVLFIHLSYMF